MLGICIYMYTHVHICIHIYIYILFMYIYIDKLKKLTSNNKLFMGTGMEEKRLLFS